MKSRLSSLSELEKHSPNLVNRELKAVNITEKYRFAVTPYYLSLADLADISDPITKQLLPSVKELENKLTKNSDPLEENKNSPLPGLIHRYSDRALIVLTNTCAVYCRHCMRKRIFKTGEAKCTYQELERIIAYIKKHREIKEVILSGGDPLTLSTEYLKTIIEKIEDIAHVDLIRLGTRCPVVMPQRFDSELLDLFSSTKCLWLNTQFNHPREVTAEASEACDRITRTGVPVSNQTVILKGINDSPEIIKDLLRKLVAIKVRPYYIFQCDQVQGTEHFWTSLWTGVDIMEQLHGHMSGLTVPTYAVDLPDGGGKVVLNPSNILSMSPDRVLLRTHEGKLVSYSNPV